MRISIFGMGYVGSVTAACLARAGHQIVGVDLSERKVAHINSGQPPVFEKGLPELFKQYVAERKIKSTSDQMGAVFETDASLVCVGTPSLESGRIDLSHVRRLCEVLRRAIFEKRDGSRHLLIFRSTMLPGSTRALYKEFFKELVQDDRLSLVYCPEFLREGSAIEDFDNAELQVMGTLDGQPEQSAFPIMNATGWFSWEGAELIKYASNYWHALKVVFGNEIGRIGKHLGINSREVMEEFIKDRKLNISSYYMRPGMPFGGSCLPKDVSALGAFARQEGINLPILESVSPSNQAHLDHLLRQLVEFGKIRVLILGLTFKANTDDLRGSPMVALCETLIGRGYHVSIYDPVLSIQSLQGANLSEIQRRMPHLASLLVDNAAESIKGAEVVLVSQRNISLECLTENINHDQIIFDLIGWSELNQLGCRVEGICW